MSVSNEEQIEKCIGFKWETNWKKNISFKWGTYWKVLVSDEKKILE